MIIPVLFQSTTQVSLDLAKLGTKVSPAIYGLMTEEINYSYDGGLYAELIRNRAFLDDQKSPAHWSPANTDSSISLVKPGLNTARPVALEVSGGVVNDGFWGFPVRPNTSYRLTVWVKSESLNTLSASIESPDGSTIYAQTKLTDVSPNWKKINAVLKTSPNAPTTANSRFVLRAENNQKFILGQASLFPPTHGKTPFRKDLVEKMQALKPTFLRFPGGNYVEGNTLNDYFPWDKTLGPIEERPGHMSCWGYRSSDGMGLAEFLLWCETIKSKPVLALYAGYALNGTYVKPGPDLDKWVQYALDEIEYVVGDTSTKWGARRAQDGHPKPYPLEYVEVGNEDGFDKSGSYPDRYLQFYKAIKAKYPKLKVIATTGGTDWLGVKFPLKGLPVEMVDEHYYSTAWDMMAMATKYDSFDRKGPKVFVGEWAAHTGPAPWEAGAKGPTSDMESAVADAAFLTGVERNSDHVLMSCYAPLFVNVNPGGMQWKLNLVGYDTLNSFGSPSYYAQTMFAQNLGDRVVSTSVLNAPVQSRGKDSLPGVFSSSTIDTRSKTVFVKIVNALPSIQAVHFDVAGGTIAEAGTLTTLTGAKADVNSIAEPKKVYPVSKTVSGLGESFGLTLPANSVNVLKVQLKR